MIAPSDTAVLMKPPALRFKRRPRTWLAAALVGAGSQLLPACQTANRPTDYAEFRSSRDPATVAASISDNVAACWFGGTRPAFADLIYVPELTSHSNRPRVLVVAKSDPTGLPKLIVEASAAARGTSVKLFGPLMATAEASAISRDVGRWTGGASGC